MLDISMLDISMLEESVHVQESACRKKMTINYSKIRETVFHRPCPSNFLLFQLLPSLKWYKMQKLVSLSRTECHLTGIYHNFSNYD